MRLLRLPTYLAVLLLLPLLLPPGLSLAEGEDPGLLLSRARDKEIDQRNYDQALALYQELLEQPELEAAVRAAALLGVGRCLQALTRLDEAEAIWLQIAEDASLPVDAREKAGEALNELRVARTGGDPVVAAAEEQRRREREREARATELVDQARRARDEGHYELAFQTCQEALEWDPKNVEASALLTEIREAMPDRAQLLRTLMKFANTTRVQAFLRLKSRFEKLERAGRNHYKAENYAQADEVFREAIALIDASEFHVDLHDEREHSVQWLRRTIEKAGEKGIRLAAVPTHPDPTAVAPSFRRRFYDLLSEVFTARSGEEDPLVLYAMLPSHVPPGSADQGLATRGFPRGITISRSEGGITRADWAERWIRRNIGTGWSSGSGEGRMSGPPRILDRFGDMLIVQHSPGVHAKVGDLIDDFPAAAAPVAVDVAVIAASTAGGTRLAHRLDVRAGPREDGESLLTSTHLVEQCLPLIANLEGIQVLGTARLTLGGLPSATLEITQHVDGHPAYAGLPPPSLVLSPEHSRSGLWLELYAEDLANAAGARRAALGLRAVTRVPRGTIVVRKQNAGGGMMRVPRPMAEQRLEIHRIVPHTGTLIVQGLTNPMQGSSGTYSGLILLLGIRPTAGRGAAAPPPDPPRQRQPGDAQEIAEEREYDLGPLATEVADALLDQDWPRQVASAPVAAATLRRAREAYLASSLASKWSRLVDPTEESPVIVRGRVATARLTPPGHTALQRAITAFRASETQLYEVEVLASETTAQGVAEWVAAAGAQEYTPGTWLVTTPAGVQAIEQRLRAAPTGSGLYVLQSKLLARATQKIAASNLHDITIVEDLRFWRHTDGTTQRLIPVLGTAEEGIVVLVRPELETDGKRLVTVDAQAARLRALEPMRLPEVELGTATITVPRHHARQRKLAAVPLGDEEALVLTMPAPEGAGRVVAIMVRVRRIP